MSVWPATPLEDEPAPEAAVPRAREGRAPRIRVVTPGLALILLVAIGGVCYRIDSSSRAARPPAVCEGLDGVVEAVAFAKEGRWVVARTIGGSLILWDPVRDRLNRRASGRRGVGLVPPLALAGRS